MQHPPSLSTQTLNLLYQRNKEYLPWKITGEKYEDTSIQTGGRNGQELHSERLNSNIMGTAISEYGLK